MEVDIYYFICPVCQRKFVTVNEYQLAVIVKEHYKKHNIPKDISETMKQVKKKTVVLE
ncbi:MAG: hypothetical protein QW607_10785 [Desulfurococcaceae archaeon]